RHFAIEQAQRGVAVRHVVADGSYRDALAPLVAELGPIRVMEPAERELRSDLAPLVKSGDLRVLPHEGWLTQPALFAKLGAPPWRMASFYRHARKATGLLVEGGKPVGGKWSFDAENREPWRGEPPAAEPPTFAPDPIVREVVELVERHFADHPGALDPERIPATRDDAEALWAWAVRDCLPTFGPYEDAMSLRSRTLFHTRVSALLNLHRLLPARVVAEAAQLDIPLASKEGFIRQILGWREFVRHVHTATDGFRAIPAAKGKAAERIVGQTAAASRDAAADSAIDRGATPSFLGADWPLPPAYWGKPSGLTCLDEAVSGVWDEGYSHHIIRLMVLCNIGALLDVSPRQLTDWFWAAYTDAYDWVVEPNVLAMGLFAVGELMTTKPYISGAGYIDRMSDYCSACSFSPKKTCPITPMYWAFLDRHGPALRGNPRMSLVLRSAAKRSADKRRRDQQIFARVRARLAAGEPISPADLDDDSLAHSA
ncbi:MAG: cryptochrome/photolyase family protein, partial [Myxococcota bacterium]